MLPSLYVSEGKYNSKTSNYLVVLGLIFLYAYLVPIELLHGCELWAFSRVDLVTGGQHHTQQQQQQHSAHSTLGQRTTQ
jgi:hypothetical protein